MIKQMYFLIQKKNYYFMPAKKNKDLQFSQFKENVSKFYKKENTNFDFYFDMRENREIKNKIDSEEDNPGNSLISFIRIFDLYEKNDAMTINQEYCDFSTVFHYLKYFSNDKIFNSLCKYDIIIIQS